MKTVGNKAVGEERGNLRRKVEETGYFVAGTTIGLGLGILMEKIQNNNVDLRDYLLYGTAIGVGVVGAYVIKKLREDN